MPSNDPARILQTMIHTIVPARRFVEDMSYEAFAGDDRTLYAVTRCLEIVSEASRRLPPQMKARYLDVPWERIAGAGNVYRHDYEDVLPSILWNTVLSHLDRLEQAVRNEIDRN